MTTQPADENEKPKDNGTAGKGLTLAWGWLSIALGVLAAGSVGTLVVVTSIKQLDTLSTVALALAVISFSAQLIVTTVQSYQSSQVNADTKVALADMRATTSSLLTNQRGQFDKVLQAALQTAIPAAVQDVEQNDDSDNNDGLTPERINELEDRLTVRFNEALGSFRGLVPPTARAATSTTSSTPRRNRQLLELLQAYPTEEEGKPVLELLKSLSPRALVALGEVGSRLKNASHADRTIQYSRSSTATTSAGFRELLDSGLLRQIASSQRVVVYEVTPTGIMAVRLLMGAGDKPDWLSI